MRAGEKLFGGLRRRWTIHLLHHAHTDVGYTAPQSIIRRRHIDYIDQALEIHQRALDGEVSLRGFKWNSECFWSIECWLRANPPERHEHLIRAIRDGAIGLSGTYLHFTELADMDLIRRVLDRAGSFAKTNRLTLDTAISADVNGFGWGYATALHQLGIRQLIACTHNAHAQAPIGERQQPFYWQTPEGNLLWVWLGEHYMLGNILGLAPGALLNYDHTPDVTFTPRRGAADYAAEERVPLYLSRLEQRGYPFDFVPVHIAGLMTDNAPPSAAIIRFVHEWNARNGEWVRLEMDTASEFARKARAASADAPIYRGDWPDWWSDGIASTPRATRHFRRAQADYARRNALGKLFNLPLSPKVRDEIDESLALYAEHTFGHAHSVQSPWGLDTTLLHDSKTAYAAQAYQSVSLCIEDVQISLGQPALQPDRALSYRVINTHSHRVHDIARLTIDHCDQAAPEDLEVFDSETGAIHPHRLHHGATGRIVEVLLELNPGESRYLSFRKVPKAPTEHLQGSSTSEGLLTPFVQIAFDCNSGITQWNDAVTGVSLLQENTSHRAFTPVHDVTNAAPALSGTEAAAPQMALRGSLLLNRKGANAIHTEGTLECIRPLGVDMLRAAAQLIYRVPGCAFFEVELCAWLAVPRVDVTIRMLKLPAWDAENLYVSLPFSAGAGNAAGELWIDKVGSVLCPNRDVLPGSLKDFCCVQSGFARINANRGVLVTTLDAPLLQFGNLTAGPREFAGSSPALASNATHYGWLLTNFWETNFTADTGGFHEFCYRVEWGTHLRDPRECFAISQSLRQGLSCFRCTSP